MLDWSKHGITSTRFDLQERDQHLHVDLGVLHGVPGKLDVVLLGQAARIFGQSASDFHSLLLDQELGPLGLIGEEEKRNDGCGRIESAVKGKPMIVAND